MRAFSEQNRAFFITGTDTDAGKTVVMAALLRAFARLGIPARALKPVQTGCAQGDAPDLRRWRAAGCADCLALETFALAASPHLAARLEGKSLDAAQLAQKCRASLAANGITLIEGAGGICAPLNADETFLDLVVALRLPAILVIADRLGCLNHAILSLNALQNAGIAIAGLILCRPMPVEAIDPGADAASQKAILAENGEFLRRLAERRHIPFLASLPHLPALDANWDVAAAHLQNAACRLASGCQFMCQAPAPGNIHAREHSC